jgi:uncharacterized protein (TIGR02118 family)
VAPRQKVIYVACFREDMTREAAGDYWTSVHAPMADGLDGMVGYIQNHVRGPLAPAEPEPGFDGFACEWWRDRESYEAGMASEAWQAIVDDGPEFLDSSASAGMSVGVEESVLTDGERRPAPGAHKLAFLIRFRAGVDREAAARCWRDVQGPLALRLPGLVGYVQNIVTGAIGAGGAIGPPAGARFDGLAEVWFADERSWGEAFASGDWAASYRDCLEMLDPAGAGNLAATVSERVIQLPA